MRLPKFLPFFISMGNLMKFVLTIAVMPEEMAYVGFGSICPLLFQPKNFFNSAPQLQDHRQDEPGPGALKIKGVYPAVLENVVCGMGIIMNHAATSSVQARAIPPLHPIVGCISSRAISGKFRLAKYPVKPGELLGRSLRFLMKPSHKVCRRCQTIIEVILAIYVSCSRVSLFHIP